MASFFFDFIKAVLCATSTRACPQITFWPEVDKLCRSKAIGLHLVEIGT